jgi:uncharacterized protein (TIGR03086 family)
MALPDRTTTALNQAEALWVDALSRVDPTTYSRASGCGDWSIADLINHVTGGAERYAMLLQGASAEQTAATRGNDYLGDDPVAEFRRHESAFRSAADAADLAALVDHRVARRPGANLVAMRVMELALHGHDLCVATAQRWSPSPAIVDFLLDEIPDTLAELRDAGMIDPASEAPAAEPAERLLALAGRTPGTATASTDPLAQAFLAKTTECFTRMIEILTVLGDDLANHRPDLPGANSCYAVVNHCIGVVEYWAGSFVAGQRIPRDRDAEFTATGTVSEIIDRLTALQERLPAWADIAVTEGIRDRDVADGVKGGTTRVEMLATATPEWTLLHILQDIAQHTGHLEITRDLLLKGIR